MNGNGKANNGALLPINVVAAVDAEERPAVLLQNFRQIFAGN